eukprot:scaffold30244_cov59-Phaeocystis_antarctica.AAC.3
MTARRAAGKAAETEASSAATAGSLCATSSNSRAPRSRPTPSSCSKRAGHAVAPSAAPVQGEAQASLCGIRRASASSLMAPREASEATMARAREALSLWCSGRSQAGRPAASAGGGGATTWLGGAATSSVVPAARAASCSAGSASVSCGTAKAGLANPNPNPNLRHGEGGHARLDDARLLRGDLGHLVRVGVGVGVGVGANPRDAAHERRAVVGAVPPAADARLHHGPLELGAGKAHERQRGELLERRRVAHRLDRRAHLLHGGHDVTLAHELAVEPDPLAEGVQVRRGEEADARPTGAQHRVAQRRRRALAVGACYVHDLQLLERVTQLREQRLEARPVLLW